jgi:pyruvate dehydrogenase E1 component beta subunit
MLWFCSDNGPDGMTGRGGRFRGSAGAFRGRKRSLFEGGIRVPAVLEWPARLKSGSVDASNEIPPEDYIVPIGKGIVRREGKDVTIVATLLMMHRALAAAEQLAAEGISAEVIDPRSLVPLDWDLVSTSVRKTNRLVVVTEGPKTGSAASEIAATAAETLIDYLAAPVLRVTSPDIPDPFSPPMEEYYRPSVLRICKAAREVMR